MKKKLLFLGTSKGTIEMIEYAKSQDIYTIVTDPKTPEESKGKQYSDEYWMIDASNIDELEIKCKEENINGVICGISTFCIPFVMDLCERLNLPTYCNKEAWHYTMDKYDFKKLCRENGVPVAKDFFVSQNPTKEEIDRIEVPVMVKAVDQSANRGMTYCYKKDEILPAIKYAHTYSKNPKIVIEKMLHGKEYTAYYAVANGEASLVNLFSDLAQPEYPGKCYSLNSTACSKIDLYKKEIDPYFKKFIKAAKIKEGVCWIELILDEDGHFYTIEMGYRMTGDMMAIPIEKITGFNSYKWLVDIAMGVKHSVQDLPKEQCDSYREIGCAYIIWSNNTKGKIKRIEGLSEISKIEGINLTQDIFEKSTYREYQYCLTYTFKANDYKDMCNIIKKINDKVKIINEKGEDIVIRFNDFESIKLV